MSRQGHITVIVDGYNVVHRVPQFRAHLAQGLEQARAALARFCADWVAARRDVSHVCLVFDGRSDVCGGEGYSPMGVRVLFTASKQAADDRILDLVRDELRPHSLIVVSDDQYVSGNARALGAQVMSAADFKGALAERAGRAQNARPDVHAKTGLSPADVKKINDDLMREWGL